MVGNPAATVITSSPGLSARSPCAGLVRELSAYKFAEEPEFTIKEWRIPTILAKRDSNSSVKGPAVSQKSRLAFVAARNSGDPKTFPVTGIFVSPAVKGFAGCNSANASAATWSILESRLLLN